MAANPKGCSSDSLGTGLVFSSAAGSWNWLPSTATLGVIWQLLPLSVNRNWEVVPVPVVVSVAVQPVPVMGMANLLDPGRRNATDTMGRVLIGQLVNLTG